MKLLSDFLPIALFFIAFKIAGIYTATLVAILAAFLQAGWSRVRNGRFESMHLITLVTLIVLGGATLAFHNEMFIKWKPTALNWALALVFLLSQFVGSKPLIQRAMEKNVHLPKTLWTRINLSWVIFFTVMGAINIYVLYHYDTNTWVNFKLFGILGATLVFVLAQAVYLTRFVDVEHLSHHQNSEDPNTSDH